MDPPENIKIIDPGHLGYLKIEWSPPDSLHDLSNCTVYYQLRFYDTYTGRWKVCIQTYKHTFSNLISSNLSRCLQPMVVFV